MYDWCHIVPRHYYSVKQYFESSFHVFEYPVLFFLVFFGCFYCTFIYSCTALHYKQTHFGFFPLSIEKLFTQSGSYWWLFFFLHKLSLLYVVLSLMAYETHLTQSNNVLWASELAIQTRTHWVALGQKKKKTRTKKHPQLDLGAGSSKHTHSVY